MPTTNEKFLTEFLENVNNTRKNFSIISADGKRQFITEMNGYGFLIYGTMPFLPAGQLPFDRKMTHVAIRSFPKTIIFLTNEAYFGVTKEQAKLPNNTLWLDDYIEQQEIYIKETLFPKFYENVSPEDASDIPEDKLLRIARLLAKEELLLQKVHTPIPPMNQLFTKQTAVQMICSGDMSDKKKMELLETDRVFYAENKRNLIAKEKFLKENPREYFITEQDEALAKALLEAEKQHAATVMIHLCVNRKKASALIPLKTLRDMVLYTDFAGLREYHFDEYSQGRRVFRKLKGDKHLIMPEHIEKISYNDDILYQKERTV